MEPVRFHRQRAEVFLSLRFVLDHPADEKIEVEPQGSQRSTEFVRDRRDEANAPFGEVDEAPAREADCRERR